MTLICPACKKKVYSEEGYETVFRCGECHKVGNEFDFEESDEGNEDED